MNVAPSREKVLEQLLKEARKIIRASSSRQLAKDWDERTTKALEKPGIRSQVIELNESERQLLSVTQPVDIGPAR